MNRPRKRDRHLPACVYERHGAFYYVKRNKWVRLAPSTDMQAALAEYARLQGHKGSGMSELIETALPTLTKGRAPATAKLYTLAARKLQFVFAEFSPQQVMPRHVAAMRRGLSDTPVMANRCVSVLRMVFNFAVEEQIVDKNPCVGIKYNPPEKRVRRITIREFNAIREEASARLQVVMDLCVLTGQRIGDVLRLRREDCTDDGVYFRQQKTGAELVVRWNAELREAVDAAKAQHGRVASLYVIKGRGPAPLAYQPVWRDWQAACEAAGVTGATLHDLRAMSGSEAKLAGLDPKALLGHKSERMTDKYLRDRDVPIVDGPRLKKGAKQ